MDKVVQEAMVTIPAAAKAMGVSRIVLDRATKIESLQTVTYNSGGKNPGFRLIPVLMFKKFLVDRGGYHTTNKGGGTQSHPWNDRLNPDSIIEAALKITNTSTTKRSASAKKVKKAAKAA